MWHRHDSKAVDAFEVRGIARMDSKTVRHRGGCDHGVIAPGGYLAATASQRGGDLAKDSRCRGVKGQGVEVGLSLLKMCLSSSPLLIVCRQKWSYRKLGESHCRDDRFAGQRRSIGDASKQDHGAGIEHTSPTMLAHRRESSVASMSLRNRSGSTSGSCRHLARRTDAGSGGAPTGLSCATAFPERVIVTFSPCATRSTMSPPWLRRSRMDTSVIDQVYHR